MIFVLRDKINSGKSLFIKSLAQELLKKKCGVRGVFTPAFIKDGIKHGHDLKIISGGVISSPIPFTREYEFENSFKWGPYHFNRKAFEAANAIDTNCDLFIIDEIGPLELHDGLGFADLLMRASSSAKDLLLVMREGLELPNKFSINVKSFKLGEYIPLLNTRS